MLYVLLAIALFILIAVAKSDAPPDKVVGWLIAPSRDGALASAVVLAVVTLAAGVYYVLKHAPSRLVAVIVSGLAIGAGFMGVPFVMLWLFPAMLMGRSWEKQ